MYFVAKRFTFGEYQRWIGNTIKEALESMGEPHSTCTITIHKYDWSIDDHEPTHNWLLVDESEWYNEWEVVGSYEYDFTQSARYHDVTDDDDWWEFLLENLDVYFDFSAVYNGVEL
jgi:hypothetical protein